MVMDYLRLFIELYDHPPAETLDGQRQFRTFCNLIDLYGFEELKKQHQAESPLLNLSSLTHINTHHYKVTDVSWEVLVSHIQAIHEKWHLPTINLSWWKSAIVKQAKDMMVDYSQSDLHYYMHKLENDQWYKEHIQDAFTFKMVRRYIDGQQKASK